MSKGIGKLQQQILDNLKPKPESHRLFMGVDIEDKKNSFWHHHREYILDDWVFDLQHIIKAIARDSGNIFTSREEVKRAFQTAFSRAVKGLVQRGLLEKVSPIPVRFIKDGTRGESFHNDIIVWPRKEIRFVKRGNGVPFPKLKKQDRTAKPEKEEVNRMTKPTTDKQWESFVCIHVNERAYVVHKDFLPDIDDFLARFDVLR